MRCSKEWIMKMSQMMKLLPSRVKDILWIVKSILLEKARKMISVWRVYSLIWKIGKRDQSSGISIQTKEGLMIMKSHRSWAGPTGGRNLPSIINMSRQAQSVSTVSTATWRKYKIKKLWISRHRKWIRIQNNNNLICYHPLQEGSLVIVIVLIWSLSWDIRQRNWPWNGNR